MSEAAVPDEVPVLLELSGAVFQDLDNHGVQLHALDNAGRVAYRNRNATAIATSDASRLLIVAGPGSGKSFLFLGRIKHWLPLHVGEQVYVSTFVRKLVKDLEGDLDAKLDDTDRKRVAVSTLHTLARSIVERHAQSASSDYRSNVRVVDRTWSETVWQDVLQFHPGYQATHGDVRERDAQFHNDLIDPSDEWQELHDTYARLSAFYNAVDFAQMIWLATQALVIDPALSQHQLWIIDEFQDFNRGEDALIRAVTGGASGVLIAGDDEQALYQTLKASTPDIIVGYYEDAGHAKAMLPFCSRCSYYICLAASAFAELHRPEGAIPKLYLPLEVEETAEKVKVIATATPGGALDYLRTFMADRKPEFESYLEKRRNGEDSDPFLLILSQTGAFSFSKSTSADEELFDFVSEYAEVDAARCGAYYRVLAYYAAGKDLEDNFAVRKILDFAGLSAGDVHLLVEEAMDRGVTLVTVLLERREDIVSKMGQTVAILDTARNDPEGVAPELIELLGLTNADQLAKDLAADPIGDGAAKREDDEAIETAPMALSPVALMTLIGSKGLSAHHVVVLGCDEMHMEKTTELTFFVGTTRARQSLHLIASRGVEGAQGLHQYLLDLPEECCQYATYTKTNGESPQEGRQGLLDAISLWDKGRAYAERQAARKRSTRGR